VRYTQTGADTHRQAQTGGLEPFGHSSDYKFLMPLLYYFVLLPRKARIDAPGVLHHIIVSGIERRKIFYDDRKAANLDKFT
jgi:hypothetical protein